MIFQFALHRNDDSVNQLNIQTMELETFLVSQPWLAVDNNLPTGTHEAMEQLETMHGMFLVNDHSFCSFAPTHGDQTQFDCAFFLRHTSSSGTKRDANGVMVNPTTASLYMRIQDTLYWVDHAHITRPPVVVSSQPAMPVHTVFELGSIRFRVWMDQALSRDDQLTRLKHVVSSLRQHLRLPSTPPPSLQPSHARLLPRESPYQVFQRHWEHDANCDGKLSAFIELCDTLGIDARVTPAQIPTPDAIAAMWQCKLVHGDLDTLMTAFGLGPLSEEGDHAGSAIEPRVHLLTY
ncbi:hypothetical protein DYB25_010526 [Aphanomyces astaci]|uniref:Uncharacterized protein n=1 Tax=Aphanomyces astaci TaxID=112090 RepID=A0A397AKP7_APHAT|nr:hypothetical protein DYB25_010526 [Aphanomyces astaci]